MIDLSADRLSFLARHRRLVLPPEPPVLSIRAPTLPQYRFEWHRLSRTLYLVRSDGRGEVIAREVTDHGAAINAVALWTRGWREGQRAKADGETR